MSLPLVVEALALYEVLKRVDATPEDVDNLSILNRALTACVAGVDNPTDRHWLIARRLLEVERA